MLVRKLLGFFIFEKEGIIVVLSGLVENRSAKNIYFRFLSWLNLRDSFGVQLSCVLKLLILVGNSVFLLRNAHLMTVQIELHQVILVPFLLFFPDDIGGDISQGEVVFSVKAFLF